jgi:integrator complex subunit 11
MFDFKYIQTFDKVLLLNPSPMVLFATPGMLHGGLSLSIFKEWCSESKNTVIIPGYCSPGTIGQKILSGIKK